jgi:hypothetical protein
MAFSSFGEDESDSIDHEQGNKPVGDRELRHLVIKKYEGS